MINQIKVGETYLNFRSGAPPPTHQSIIALAALSLSSLPAGLPLPFSPSCAVTPPLPFSVKFFKASNARILCKGAPCTMRVSALSRSLKVPLARILRRKTRSEAELPAASDRTEKAEFSEACNEEARSSKAATWEVDWETTVSEAMRGGRKLNQPGVAGTSSLALEEDGSGLSGASGGMDATFQSVGGWMDFFNYSAEVCGQYFYPFGSPARAFYIP
jgi:hypothetical protein